MKLSCEMYSQDGEAFPNIVRFHRHDGMVYIEIDAKHDGTKVSSVVKVEAAVLRYHLIASGLLTP